MELLAVHWDLVGIDGMTYCLTIVGGYNGRDENDIARWFKELPRKFSRNGASVLIMDHITKANNGAGRFAIGSQMKLGAIDGASFLIDDIKKPFGKGLRGEATIRITKDKNGSLRRHGGNYKDSDRTQAIARLVVDATKVGAVTGELLPPSSQSMGAKQAEKIDDMMRRCASYIENHLNCLTGEIEEAVTGNGKEIRDSVQRLIDLGYVEMEQVGRAKKHRMVRSLPRNEVIP